MTTVAREFEIIYGTFSVAGATTEAGTPRILDSQIRFESDPDRIAIFFSFTVQQSTEAAFLTETDLVEKTFRTPYKKLTVKQGAGTPIVLDPATGTGLNIRPRIDKREELVVNTGRSRRYHVIIEAGLPADLYANDGRRNSAITVTFTPNERRTLILEGEWTSTATESSARAAYLAGIDAFASEAFSGPGGGATYDKIAENTLDSPDGQDNVLQFTRTYQEILSDQSSGIIDDPEISDPTLEISRLEPAPGDSQPAQRLSEIGVSFTAFIKKGVDPRTKYTGTMRSFLIDEALSLFDASSGALVAETVNKDPHNNRLLVNLQILAQIGNLARISFRATRESDIQFGDVLVPAWTGDPLSYYIFQGHMTQLRVEREEERVLAGAGGGSGFGGGGGPSISLTGSAALAGTQGGVFGAGIGGFFVSPGQLQGGGAGAGAGSLLSTGGGFEILLSQNRTITSIRLGTAEHGIDVDDITTVRVFQAVNPVSGGGGDVATPGT